MRGAKVAGLFKYSVVLPEPTDLRTARPAGKDKQYGIPGIRASSEYRLLGFAEHNAFR
jgi:hypothetical protein